MKLIFLCIFFYLQIWTINSVAKKKCGNFQTNEMLKIQYTNEDSKLMEVQIANTPINGGSGGKIYIGYTGPVEKELSNENINEKLPKNKCVAIKIYEQENLRDFFNGIEILKILKENDLENIYFVNAMDNGVIADEQKFSGFLSIMEFAELSLDNELQIVKEKLRQNYELVKLIKNVIKILVVVHKVCVHLDFKPKNLLYFVGKGLKKEIKNFWMLKSLNNTTYKLKLTDFDGSAFINEENGSGEVEKVVMTPLYAAPELLNQRILNNPEPQKSAKLSSLISGIRKKFKGIVIKSSNAMPMTTNENTKKYVTPKMDIWSAGITIYEIVLSNFTYNSSSLTPIKESDFRKALEDKLELIGELYRFAFLYGHEDSDHANLVVKLDLEEAYIELGTEQWWDRYSGVISNIFDIWHKYTLPEIAFLLVNMLDIDPNVRMTAKGIIAFLGDKCRPRIIKDALFSNVSADQLKEWIDTEISRLNKIKTSKSSDNYHKSLKRIEKKLAEVKKINEKFVEKIKGRGELCE